MTVNSGGRRCLCVVSFMSACECVTFTCICVCVCVCIYEAVCGCVCINQCACACAYTINVGGEAWQGVKEPCDNDRHYVTCRLHKADGYFRPTY